MSLFRMDVEDTRYGTVSEDVARRCEKRGRGEEDAVISTQCTCNGMCDYRLRLCPRIIY